MMYVKYQSIRTASLVEISSVVLESEHLNVFPYISLLLYVK